MAEPHPSLLRSGPPTCLAAERQRGSTPAGPAGGPGWVGQAGRDAPGSLGSGRPARGHCPPSGLRPRPAARARRRPDAPGRGRQPRRRARGAADAMHRDSMSTRVRYAALPHDRLRHGRSRARVRPVRRCEAWATRSLGDAKLDHPARHRAGIVSTTLELRRKAAWSSATRPLACFAACSSQPSARPASQARRAPGSRAVPA